MYSGFRAGVDRGGLTTGFEVKMLILYLLRECKEPVKLSNILTAVAKTGSANYFEVTNGACELLETNNIAVVDNSGFKSYRITKKGEEAFETMGRELPFTIKERVLEQLQMEQNRERHGGDVRVSTEKVQDGYQMTLEIRDVGSEMLKLQLLLPEERYCKEIEARFLKDPAVVYKGVVALLTGSFSYLGELL